jgi:hypothetical protein
MSSTRIADDPTIFHQERYASSPEFERGLNAKMVAKRCALLNPRDRELIWFIQYLSHKDGGVAAIAKELLKKFSHRLGTATMVQLGKKSSQNYTADEVRKIRIEISKSFRGHFILRGEINSDDKFEIDSLQQKHLRALHDERLSPSYDSDDFRLQEIEQRKIAARKEAEKNPNYYPVSKFFDICKNAATTNFDNVEDPLLEKELCRLCLDPNCSLKTSGLWYFSDFLNVLRDYHKSWVADKSEGVVTALGKKVWDTLDYTLHGRILSLLEGNARLGKSHSARTWCEQHPGKSRFIEIPPGNDEASFFRALARGLGLGNFLNYKVVEIRERVESVLLTGDILLVLDESQRLWPRKNYRYAFPTRVEWVMTMGNAGVPICMISTPQFTTSQNVAEKNGWNSAQLTGRIGHYEFLPNELSKYDLVAVAQSVLSEASKEVLTNLAIYAQTSARYLAAVDSIAKRARFLAQRNGNEICSTDDIRRAMNESVIPSDTMLVRTLESAKKVSRKSFPIEMPLPAINKASAATRETSTLLSPPINRRGDISELVKI